MLNMGQDDSVISQQPSYYEALVNDIYNALVDRAVERGSWPSKELDPERRRLLLEDIRLCVDLVILRVLPEH